MAELTIQGVVQVVFPRVDNAAGTFSKRDIVVRTEEQYPHDIAIQFTQNNCDILDQYSPGETVIISFNLRGQLNGWTNPQGEVKYFNTVQGWKISRVGAAAGAQPATQAVQQPMQAPTPGTPLPAGKRYVHTDTQYTEAQYLANPSWNHDILVANGKGRWEASTAPAGPSGPVI